MVEPQFSKLMTRVRFPSSPPLPAGAFLPPRGRARIVGYHFWDLAIPPKWGQQTGSCVLYYEDTAPEAASAVGHMSHPE